MAVDLYGLKFGRPRIVMTKHGEREVSEARATEEFWEAWRADKAAVRAAGYSVSRNRDGDWKVAIWRDSMTSADKASSIEASRAANADIDIPVPDGLALLPYQKAGVAYALSRPGTLFADEMGLGKTVQAIATANAIKARRILVVCPASLMMNWRNEIMRWQTLGLPVHIIRPGCKMRDDDGWHIINYDIVRRYVMIKEISWDVAIFDETHYLKNGKALRTRFLLGGRKSKIGEDAQAPVEAKVKLLLTGTPITNLPAEVFSLIHYLDPKRWSSMAAFAKRYCGAVYNGFVVQMGRAQNLDELQERLRATVMVRRLKSDVLTELPPKRRQVVTVEVDGAEDLVAVERESQERTDNAIAAANYAVQKAESEGTDEEYRAAVANLRKTQLVAFEEMAKARHNLAMKKVPAVVEHLENTSGKVVVFAHHKDVVAALRTALLAHNVAVITGDTPVADRHGQVARFQTDPTCRFFIGNIQAAGVGITLTAASHVVFAELDWVPANLSQAEDRCHRIGQLDSVLVQHLVVDGSLDQRMASLLIEKQEVIKKALDDQSEMIEYPGFEIADTVVAPSAVEKKSDVVQLTDDQVKAIHEALRTVAAYDDDRARSLNRMGFSKIDTHFGCDLAQRDRLSVRQAAVAMKMVRKYRKQYPDDVYHRIFI